MKELVNMNKDLLDNIFDDEYFEKLYIDIMDKVKGKEVYITNLYVSVNPIRSEELGFKGTLNPSFLDRKFYNMKRDSLCFKELLDKKGISSYPVLVVEESQKVSGEYNLRGIWKDVITEFLFPLLKVKFYSKDGFSTELDYFYDEKEEYDLKVLGTNYFVLDIDNCPEIYTKQYPEFDFFVDDYKSTRPVNLEELEIYVRNICNKDNYLKYINFLIYYLKKITFEEIYDISAFIPDSLIPYYEEVKDINKDKLLEHEEMNENKLTEKKDAIFFNFEMIVEIKNLINGLSNDKKNIYYHRLDNLIQKYSKIILKVNPELVFNFQKELSKLRADIMTYEMSLFQYDNFYKYLENVYDLSKSSLIDDDLDKIVVDLFKYINKYLSNKEKLEFDKYYQSQELICSIFMNILIFNPNYREYILNNITILYQQVLQEKFYTLLNDCTNYLDNKDLSIISIYSLNLENLTSIDFINQSLSIIDKLEKELIFEVMDVKENKLVKRKI